MNSSIEIVVSEEIWLVKFTCRMVFSLGEIENGVLPNGFLVVQ